jgi:hypothetical protein
VVHGASDESDLQACNQCLCGVVWDRFQLAALDMLHRIKGIFGADYRPVVSYGHFGFLGIYFFQAPTLPHPPPTHTPLHPITTHTLPSYLSTRDDLVQTLSVEGLAALPLVRGREVDSNDELAPA